MRTKTIYFFSLFLTITMMTGCFHISSGPKPSKSKMTKKYSVTPFNKIENKAPANIVFTQGNVTKVEADGPDNYIPQLIVMVKDSTLSISMDKDKFKNFKSSKINISITSPVLCNIKQRGVGSIYLKDSVKVTDLSISAEGVGSIEANALMARCIKVSQEGVGTRPQGSVRQWSASYCSCPVHNRGTCSSGTQAQAPGTAPRCSAPRGRC